MKKKLLLILFTFALSLGIFGASFSLDSFAYPTSSPVPHIYPSGTYNLTGDFPYTFTAPFVLIYEPSGSTHHICIYTQDGSSFTQSIHNWPSGYGINLAAFLPEFYFSPFAHKQIALEALYNYSTSVYDDEIQILKYSSYWLGGFNSVVPVLSGIVSDNVDHINVELYWDDLDSSPIASYTINPVLGNFFNLGSSVPYIGMQGHKMIYKLVPYSVSGNYGATYYSTVTSFNLNNTRYVDVPKANGTGTGRLDFNSYTQSVNSYSPTSNINQSTVLDTYYYRTYNNDYSTSEEFYNEYDYSTIDKSYFSNNDLTFNTNIEINFPQLDGDWLKNLFQTFNFNLPTDLMNHWIPGVPNWVIDIIIAGIAIIVAAVIAKLLFTIL